MKGLNRKMKKIHEKRMAKIEKEEAQSNLSVEDFDYMYQKLNLGIDIVGFEE